MIEVENLYKKYGKREALKGISFKIMKAEIYGLLGPNGAGKTTAISIMSTILQPDSGRVIIDGYDLSTNANSIKQTIGVVPQEIALYNELSANDNLMFWGGLYGVPEKDLHQRCNELLKLFGLYERKDDILNSYSGGMKRRINIAAAILHNPKVLFMDEPTVGVDIQSRNLIFEVVKHLNQQGMTIVYTTHYMEEAERLCDRIGIVDDGKIIIEGTLEQLKNSSLVKDVIKLSFLSHDSSIKEKLFEFWKDIQFSEREIAIYSDDVKADLPLIVSKCIDLGIEITNIEIHKANLESIFLTLTGKQLRDK